MCEKIRTQKPATHGESFSETEVSHVGELDRSTETLNLKLLCEPVVSNPGPGGPLSCMFLCSDTPDVDE